jgi:hypothetical protein
MKEFGTHLPEMPRGELVIVLGEIFKRLVPKWQGTFDPGRVATGAHPLELQARRTSSKDGLDTIMSLKCQILPFPNGEFELRASFNEGSESGTRETEEIVDATMIDIHAALCWILGNPPGTPPALNMWLMSRGKWQIKHKFNG